MKSWLKAMQSAEEAPARRWGVRFLSSLRVARMYCKRSNVRRPPCRPCLARLRAILPSSQRGGFWPRTSPQRFWKGTGISFQPWLRSNALAGPAVMPPVSPAGESRRSRKDYDTWPGMSACACWVSTAT